MGGFLSLSLSAWAPSLSHTSCLCTCSPTSLFLSLFLHYTLSDYTGATLLHPLLQHTNTHTHCTAATHTPCYLHTHIFSYLSLSRLFTPLSFWMICSSLSIFYIPLIGSFYCFTPPATLLALLSLHTVATLCNMAHNTIAHTPLHCISSLWVLQHSLATFLSLFSSRTLLHLDSLLSLSQFTWVRHAFNSILLSTIFTLHMHLGRAHHFSRHHFLVHTFPLSGPSNTCLSCSASLRSLYTHLLHSFCLSGHLWAFHFLSCLCMRFADSLSYILLFTLIFLSLICTLLSGWHPRIWSSSLFLPDPPHGTCCAYHLVVHSAFRT